MTSDLDIYRSARELVRQHGEDAPLVAALRADELLAEGEIDGQRVWIAITRACEALLIVTTPAGALLN